MKLSELRRLVDKAAKDCTDEDPEVCIDYRGYEDKIDMVYQSYDQIIIST